MTVASAPQLRRAGVILTIAGLAAIAIATLSPERPVAVVAHFCLVCGSFGGVNTVLNVLLFVPLGAGLALAGVSGKRAVLVAFAVSVCVETAQWLVITGRYATIGDLITNTIGGAVGFAIGRYGRFWVGPSRRAARNLMWAWSALWLAVQAVSNFGFSSSLPNSQYHGQLARAFGSFAVFPGVVLAATVGNVRIPDTAIAESLGIRQLLLSGADVVAAVVPAGPTAAIAPIVRLAGEKNQEIAFLGQYHEQLVFSVRTGAAVLRLRPPRFALSGAFASGVGPSSGDDALRLSGRYIAREVSLRAESSSARLSGIIPLSASMGWTFWLPFQWLIEGTAAELVVSAIWMACLAIPFGYWALRTATASPSRGILGRWGSVLILAALLFLAAFIVLPAALGLAVSPARDWLATIAGIGIGCGLSATLSKLIGSRMLENER